MFLMVLPLILAISATNRELEQLSNEDKIPVSDVFLKYLEKYNLDFERLALHVGEDYVLLGTAPESSIKKYLVKH